ncbi:hypothetical protein SORBI_3001G278400 [Sorghum bicolor]|uniref:Uncharacterized protein n=1 Tax=Sorghum bicolor TaxID=4558 RepID=A0A1Z5S7X5_SORBI|nr:hypothetical protein SORBI_3001G278400 [Sorghum bicolor]
MVSFSVKRLRLQGLIEGSIDKLRRTARLDARAKARSTGHMTASLATLGSDNNASDGDSEDEEKPAMKRELVNDDKDSDELEEENEPLAAIVTATKKRRARKLSDEFDRIAVEQQLVASTGEISMPRSPPSAPRSPTSAAPSSMAPPLPKFGLDFTYASWFASESDGDTSGRSRRCGRRRAQRARVGAAAASTSLHLAGLFAMAGA